jgi:linoleoyl-CoA desaturase
MYAPAQKFTYKKGDFLDTVKTEAIKYFEEKGISHKAGYKGMTWFFMTIILMEVAMYFTCLQNNYVAAFAHGILRAMLVVQSTHGGSHFAYSLNPMVNRWVYRVGTVMIGLWNPKVWDIQHVVAHHVYTNEWPYDTDSAFPIKSVAPNQKRFWYHKYQHIYIWLVYAFTIPLVYVNSMKDTIMSRQVTFRMRYQVSGAQFEAWACTVLGGLYLLLPHFFLPFWAAMKINVFSNVVSSLFFSLQFVVNHETDAVVHGMPDPHTTIDWGEYQVKSSTSFAPTSHLSTNAAGGLNTQIEHHLFPGVYYGHYVELSKIVKRVCKDFGLTYNESPTIVGALIGHYRLLRNPPKSTR